MIPLAPHCTGVSSSCQSSRPVAAANAKTGVPEMLKPSLQQTNTVCGYHRSHVLGRCAEDLHSGVPVSAFNATIPVAVVAYGRQPASTGICHELSRGAVQTRRPVLASSARTDGCAAVTSWLMPAAM